MQQPRRYLNSPLSKEAHIGFVGLGAMGKLMALNLFKAQKSLIVYDLSPAAVQSFVDECSQDDSNKTSVRAAANMEDMTRNCHTIITMLPSSPHVSLVYSGHDKDTDANARAGPKRESIIGSISGGGMPTHTNHPLLIDCSTIDPTTSHQLALLAACHTTTMVDAPVSGGINGARDGTLTFMCGAPNAEAFQLANAVLQPMGRNVVHCGPNGSGQAAKICNNLCLGISMAAVCESMALGMRLGVEPKVLAQIFNSSSARCWASDSYNPVPGVMSGVPASRDYAGGFQTRLMDKDMRLAIAAAKQCKAQLPLGKHAQKLYAQAMEQGLADRDFGVIFKAMAPPPPEEEDDDEIIDLQSIAEMFKIKK